MSINVARVILAGLAAGVVANVLDFGGGLLLQDDHIAQAQRLGLRPEDLQASFPIWIGVDFVYGLLLAFAYAAMRPRFGPGPPTAIIAGATLFLTVTAILFGFMAMGMFTQALFVKGAILSAVTTLVASLTAGAIYKE